MNELVCIGQDLEHAAAGAALDLCLMTDVEMAPGASAGSDPFHEAWERELAAGSHEHEHEHGH